jgi:hypothetical protein
VKCECISQHGNPEVSIFESADSSARCEKSSLRVSHEMTLDTFRQQTFAPTLTSSRKRGTAASCLHACAKTVLLFACPL